MKYNNINGQDSVAGSWRERGQGSETKKREQVDSEALAQMYLTPGRFIKKCSLFYSISRGN